MKKIILAMTILALAGSQVQTAKAHGYYGGGGWPIEAGVLGGLAVGTAIGASAAQQPVYYAPGYSGYYNGYYNAPSYPYQYYQQPAPVYAPPVYAAPPVVTFGFNFGQPYYGGYYRGGYYHGYRGGYYGHNYGHPYYNHGGHGRW